MATALKTIEGFKADGDRGGTPTTAAASVRWMVDNRLEEMRRFRDHIQIVDRLNNCVRLREGAYDATQLQAIAAYGGSDIFARLTTNKIRGAASMLRAIFIQGDTPWTLDPTPVPSLPENITGAIDELVNSEVQSAQQLQPGVQIDEGMIERRKRTLTDAANESARKMARMEAIKSARYVNDLLVEGGFYRALDEFILDFCTYPFAVLAGPTAVMETGVTYVNGMPKRVRKAVLRYRRVDPYDIMWGPGAIDIGNAELIERMRMTRASINRLIGLPGYNEDAIRSVLRDYGDSGYSYRQFFEQVHEDAANKGGLLYQAANIDILAYTGTMTGAELKEWEIPPPEGMEEPLEDDFEYGIQAWVCGEYTLKVQIDPDPSNRTNYYSAAYEPVSGSIPGTALAELISDIQEGYNATLRSLINNIAISSGPQVGLNRDRWIQNSDNEVRLVPWQIWEFDNDPSTPSGEKPIEFFQPQLNGQELMAILSFFQNMADEISGIPRYLTGSDKIGGAGRTSSGLSMLMSNANRTMTSVAGGIDNYVLEPSIHKTYDLVLLTTGNAVLRGDETIVARGATYAEQIETDRMRMIEFMQATMNPIDTQIMGRSGRATLLREVSHGFLKNGMEVVPSEETVMQQEEAAKQAAMQQQQMAEATGQPPGQEGEGGPSNNGSSMGGQQAKPTQQRTQPNQQSKATDNAMRVRSPGAVQRNTRGT